MAYMEKYMFPHVYTWKILGITAYGDFNTVFWVNFSKSVGMGAYSHEDNHESHEGEKRCYNRCPLIYEVRRGTWWPKCIMHMERTSQGQARTSLDFSLPKTNERTQRVNSCWRGHTHAQSKIHHMNRSEMYTSIAELKVHKESSEHGPDVQVWINVQVSHIKS